MLNRFLLVVFVGATLPAYADAQTGINWVDSVETAQAQAAQSQRLILLHFYSDDCGPCRRLDARVFPTAAVQQAVQRGYVATKINTSKDPQTAKTYNVYTWPTDVLVDARGRELYRTISPQDANQYSQMLNATLASYQASMPYNPQIDQRAGTEQSPLNAVAALNNNVGLYGQAANQQLHQTQEYAQHVMDQYKTAAQGAYGQAQQTAQTATQGVQNQLAQAQQTAQFYGQQAQQTVQQAGNTAQSQLGAAQQTAAQYGQNAQLYGQQTTQAAVDRVTSAQQAAQQAAQAAQQGLYAQQQPNNNTATTPYSPAYDPARNSTLPISTPVQAPPYGQMTQNPYVNQGQPVASNTTAQQNAPPVTPIAPYVPTPPVMTTNPTLDPAVVAQGSQRGTQQTVGQTAPHGDIYANNANAAQEGQPTETAPPTPPISPAPVYEPAKTRPLGIDGYCPVTLMTKKKWAKGDVRFGAVHRSRLYLFMSEAEQQQFMADPDRYAPMLSGYDAVAYRKTGRLVEGSRAHGLTFMNQMFLFESEESLAEFAKSPQVFLGAVQQAMQATPQRAVR